MSNSVIRAYSYDKQRINKGNLQLPLIHRENEFHKFLSLNFLTASAKISWVNLSSLNNTGKDR